MCRGIAEVVFVMRFDFLGTMFPGKGFRLMLTHSRTADPWSARATPTMPSMDLGNADDLCATS
jgi:hypothetical protein